ncbi:MAG: right-handed parallel beta-helix repeat-containing protein [Candidatus Micrarchaeota archaeon]|nr:right-handed parallel beta-helix repeat-containing protein [Candidatus Micrarchaeota archaeon]
MEINAQSGNNTFCLNNFTNTSGYYVQDLNGSNFYNCTYGGISQTQGNIWANVMNGSVAVTGMGLSSIAGLYIGDAGAGVPYNNSTSGTKFTCNFQGCGDYAPLTQIYGYVAPNVTAISVVPAAPTKAAGISCNVTAVAQNSTMNVSVEWYMNGANQTSLVASYIGLANNTATLVSNLTAGNFSKNQNWSCRATAFDGTSYSGWVFSANVTVNNTAPSGASVGNFTDAAAGHSFTVNGSATDLDGGADIAATNISATAGACSYVSNFTSGTAFNVMYNCTSTTPTPSVALAQTIYYNNSTSLNGAFSVAVSGNYAYIASYNGNSLTIFDATNPSAPVQIAYYNNSTSLNGARSVAVSGNYAYVASAGANSLTIFNITAPSAPVQMAYYTNDTSLNSANSVAVSGNYAYVESVNGNSLTIFNITAPSAPVQMAYYTNDTSLNHPRSVAVSGNYAYVVSQIGNSLTIFDATNPSAPVQIAYYNNSTSLNAAYSVAVSGNYAFVASYTGKSLTIFNVTTYPITIGFTDAAGAYASNSSAHAYPNNLPSVSISSVANATVGHWFTYNTTISDLDGLSDLNYTLSATYGSCVSLSNSTNATSITLARNCTASSPGTATIATNATDLFGAAAQANVTNAYPDHAASLTAPAASSPLYITSTATCTAGSFSDMDSDTENTSARAWAWYKNGALQAGQNNSTLVLSAVGSVSGDNISCRENVTANTWTASIATNLSANVTLGNTPPVIAYQTSFANASTNHTFTATAGVSDVDGGSTVAATNISASAGSCVYANNSTLSIYFNVTYTCTPTVPGTASITIGFTDNGGNYVQTAAAGNAYPDQLPTLTSVPINPSPAYKSSTLTCGNGTFADPDSDTENASARAWKWYRNSNLIAGQAAYTLAPTNFEKGDNITCEQSSTADTWTASAKSTNSSVLAILNSAPTEASVGNFTDAATGHSFTVNGTVTDADNGTDISASNISASAGACSYLSNSTSGTSFSVMYNCAGTSTATPAIAIGFTDSTGAYAQNSSTHAYPDHAASLTQPTLPVILHPSAIANCTPGNFSDIDSDLENVSARAWSWYRNGTIIAGQTGQTLSLAALGVQAGENISCSENATASNWTASNAANASSNTTIAFGCGAALSSAGTVYMLASASLGNGNTCFNVTAANVTLDCNGYSITGTNTSGKYGVYSNQPGTIVQNCTISNFSEGIRFAGATSGIIRQNAINSSFSGGNGMRFTSGANGASATNNTVSSGGAANGIYIDGASNAKVDCQGGSIIGANASSTYGVYTDQANTTVKNCQVSSFATGIYFNGATNGTISATSASTTRALSGNDGYGIYIYNGASYNSLAGSNGTSANGYGIALFSGSNYNNITICAGMGASAGIRLDASSNNNTISNSTGASAAGHGIILSSSSNNTLSGSNGTSSGSGYGIWLNASLGSRLSGVQGAAGSNCSIAIEQGSGNSVMGSTGNSSSGSGICLTGSSNNTISNSSGISGGSGYGISISSGSNNSLARVSAGSSTGGGISISGSSGADVECSGSAITGGNAAGTYGIYTTSANTTASGCMISNFSSAIALNGATNGLFVNNTLQSQSPGVAHLQISAGSSGNTFYWNNFTSTSGLYANDSGASNSFNATVGGKNQGNIWANVISGDVSIQGTASYAFGGLFIGTSGPGWPYNSTNSQGKVAGNAVDYAPAITINKPAYSVDAMQGGAPNMYFANGTIANITVNSSSLLSAPNLTLRLSDGTLLLANATMHGTGLNGTGPYYYEFAANATGWHSATIWSGQSAYAVPYLFYSGMPWQGNFTNSSGAIFSYRVPLNASEGGVVGRRRQPVGFSASFPGGASENSIRLALWQGGQLVSIPFQLYSRNYTDGGKLNATGIEFIDAYALSQNRTYYLYYSYADMAPESIGTDLANSGAYTFSNRNYEVDTRAAYGGTVTRVESGQNGLNLTDAAPPTDAPEMNIISFPPSRAYNASVFQSSLTSGTVFTKYSGAGSTYAYNVSAMLTLNYTVSYTFYAGTDYFILETNSSSPFFTAPISPFVYSDAGIYLSKDRFSAYAYGNGSTATGALPANISGISGARWVSFEEPAQKAGFGLAFISNSSNAAISPLAGIADSAAGFHIGRQMFNGTGSASDWFYSKNAFVIYDPSSANEMDSAYLAITNPPIVATGARENLNITPPAHSLEGHSPPGANDTDNLTCFALWDSSIPLISADLLFSSSNYSANSTVALSGNSSWSNFTVDSQFLQAGAGTCTITAYDLLGQGNITAISFTLGDRKAPVLLSTNYSPSTPAEVDPNVTLRVNATLAEFTDVSTAILQYNSTANGTLANETMGWLVNSSHIFVYNASFTPIYEANYTYRIWANDTLGNSNASGWTAIPVYYDWTWNATPFAFSVAALFGTNATVANVVLNNTGDMPLSFRLSSNYYLNTMIFYNGTAEGGGYRLDVPAGEAASVEVIATAKTGTQSADAVSIAIAALNASADPQARYINGTFVSYSGGSFLYLSFTGIPSSITAGSAAVALNASMKNLGNETATGANFTWSLPSDWSVVSGSTHSGPENLAPDESRNFQVSVAVPSSAQAGAMTVDITGTCDGENKTSGASAIVTVISSQPGLTPSPPPSSGAAGGGGAPSGKSNFTIVQKKVEKTLTVEEKENFFSTLAGYDLVRGKDTSFGLNITNPFDAPLENVTINVSGYLYQYINMTPVFIPEMAPHEQKTVRIGLSAPSYFTEDTFTLYFDIRGTSVEETEDSLTTTKLQERRTVDLRVLDMDRDSAFKLLQQAYTIRQDMERSGIFQGEAKDQFAKANASYSSDKFGPLKDAVGRMYEIYTAGVAAGGQLNGLRAKLDDAKASNIKTAQTSRLYTLANLAFERGDYANAQKLANDAELTYQLESVQGFSLEAFIAKYGTVMVAAFFAVMLLSGCMYMGLRYYVMGTELSQLTNEEAIVLGLIKETQKDYFEGGKMSTEEYSLSAQQYDERLGKIIQRKVKLETERKNFLNFSGRKAMLLMEKARLEQLMKDLQRDYLEKGNLETGVYENRMKSYVSRLSEIEETIALEETQDQVKSDKSIFNLLKPKKASGTEAQLAGKEKAAEKGQAAGKKAKGQPGKAA